MAIVIAPVLRVTVASDVPNDVQAFFAASRFHHLRFDDVGQNASGAIPRETVRRILSFGARLSLDDRGLVHCFAGVSRSAGAAYALACQYAPPGTEDAVLRQLVSKHPWIKPNRRVVALADNLLHRIGRMNAAVVQIWVMLTARSTVRLSGEF